MKTSPGRSLSKAVDEATPAARSPGPRKPRVLVLTSTFPRWTGDSEPRFVLDLCRHLVDYADILVLAPHAHGAAREEVLEGVHVRRFRFLAPRLQSIPYGGGIVARIRENPWRVLQLPLYFAALCLALRRSIRTWSPDAIHAHWIVPQAFAATLMAPATIPILCTSHGGDLHALRRRLFLWVKSWTLRRCSHVTVVGRSMLPEAQELAAPRPVQVIPMGTELAATFVPPAGHDERDGDHLIFAGRLVQKKGLEYLLEALAALQTTHPGLRLTVVGDGPLRSELQERAIRLGLPSRVTFVGAVGHSALAALYRTATLAVFPFVVAPDGDREGFGLVVTEAMGCECPVVASDLPAIRENVEPGVTGILTPPGDVSALARAIDAALGDPDLRADLARAALERARARFDWGSIAARYQQVFDEMVCRPQHSPDQAVQLERAKP